MYKFVLHICTLRLGTINIWRTSVPTKKWLPVKQKCPKYSIICFQWIIEKPFCPLRNFEEISILIFPVRRILETLLSINSLKSNIAAIFCYQGHLLIDKCRNLPYYWLNYLSIWIKMRVKMFVGSDVHSGRCFSSKLFLYAKQMLH